MRNAATRTIAAAGAGVDSTVGLAARSLLPDVSVHGANGGNNGPGAGPEQAGVLDLNVDGWGEAMVRLRRGENPQQVNPIPKP